MIYHKMTDRDLERLQSLAVEAALIVQDYRPAGTDTIEWMAQCDQYRELAMMGSYCLLDLTTRNKERRLKSQFRVERSHRVKSVRFFWGAARFARSFLLCRIETHVTLIGIREFFIEYKGIFLNYNVKLLYFRVYR